MTPIDAGLLGADQWLAGLDTPAWLVEPGGATVVLGNAAAADCLGLPAQDLVGRPAQSLLPGLEDEAFWAEVRLGHAGQLVSDIRMPRAGAADQHYQRRIVPLGAPAGAYLVTLTDRTAAQVAEQEREALLSELRATLEAAADGILVTDTRGVISAFNRRFASLWSLPEAALAERNDAAVLGWMQQSVADGPAYQARLDDIQAQLLLCATDTLTLRDGSVLQRHTEPQWSAGRPIGRVYSFRQVQRGRAMPEAGAGLRGVDERLSWPDRPGFLHHLDQAVAQAQDEGCPLSVLCVEFDRQALFGLDGEGQARAMSELAEGLQAQVRESHVLARLGAGRFGLLLRQSGEVGAEQLARRLVASAVTGQRGLLATTGLKLHVGVAVHPQAGVCADDLLRHAEQALEAARLQPRAHWHVHQLVRQPQPESRRQQRLERAVREGLVSPSFRIHFQPRVDARTGAVQSVEALLRWHDPEDGLLLPAQFLGLAERAGVMGGLDDWALEHALRQAGRWAQRHRMPALTVNVSGSTLCQPAYARRVAALLQASGWPARQLELDLTELALQRDPDAALWNLQALQRLGVRLVLEHWGQGDCAVGLLRRFPLSAVKLDRSLVRATPRQGPEGEQARGLMRSLVSLAHAHQMEALATGVENESQRDFVQSLGCSGWQGLLAWPALDARAVERSVLQRVFEAEPAPAMPRVANG